MARWGRSASASVYSDGSVKGLDVVSAADGADGVDDEGSGGSR